MRLQTSENTRPVIIYTDGACLKNPGPGGYAALLCWEGREKEITGGEQMTTNNRMELLAAISGLETLNRPCRVSLYSDSRYLVDAISKGWLNSWKRNGWLKADKTPVLNRELWERLSDLLNIHDAEFIWVRGHAGHPQNERCDRLASTEAASRAVKPPEP